MNKVIQVLQEEHRLIGRAAACLDRLADEALDLSYLCVATAIDLLDFFEDFGDAVHQEREESILFPALLDAGLARHHVLSLSEDHDRERRLLHSMWTTLSGAANGDSSSLDAFSRLASEFAAAQIEHAEEEDRVLLPLIGELVDGEAERRIMEGFRDIDRRLLLNPREHYIDIVERAASRLGSIANREVPRHPAEREVPSAVH